MSTELKIPQNLWQLYATRNIAVIKNGLCAKMDSLRGKSEGGGEKTPPPAAQAKNGRFETQFELIGWESERCCMNCQSTRQFDAH